MEIAPATNSWCRLLVCWVRNVERFQLAEDVQIGNLNTFRDGARVLGTIVTEARRRRGIQRVEPAPAGNQQEAKAAATTA